MVNFEVNAHKFVWVVGISANSSSVLIIDIVESVLVNSFTVNINFEEFTIPRIERGELEFNVKTGMLRDTVELLGNGFTSSVASDVSVGTALLGDKSSGVVPGNISSGVTAREVVDVGSVFVASVKRSTVGIDWVGGGSDLKVAKTPRFIISTLVKSVIKAESSGCGCVVDTDVDQENLIRPSSATAESASAASTGVVVVFGENYFSVGLEGEIFTVPRVDVSKLEGDLVTLVSVLEPLGGRKGVGQTVVTEEFLSSTSDGRESLGRVGPGGIFDGVGTAEESLG
jgi:hypothetical protein